METFHSFLNRSHIKVHQLNLLWLVARCLISHVNSTKVVVNMLAITVGEKSVQSVLVQALVWVDYSLFNYHSVKKWGKSFLMFYVTKNLPTWYFMSVDFWWHKAKDCCSQILSADQQFHDIKLFVLFNIKFSNKFGIIFSNMQKPSLTTSREKILSFVHWNMKKKNKIIST